VHLHTVVIKTSITDHYTIIVSLIISPNNKKHNIDSRTNNTASYINYNKVVQLLSINEWTGLFETSNPSAALNIFNGHILDTIYNFIVSKHHTSTKNRKLKPWITN
jgi:hypothetical protein